MYLTQREEAQAHAANMDRLARQNLGEWISGLARWRNFITLTYDPRRCKSERVFGHESYVAPALDVVVNHVRSWLKDGVLYSGGDLRAVAGIEAHRSGWPHVHVICDAAPLLDSAMIDWAQAWYMRHGYARWERAVDQSAVSSYVAKYLTKRSGDLMLYGRYDFRSGAAISP